METKKKGTGIMKKIFLLTICTFFAQLSYTQNITFYSADFERGVKDYLQIDSSAVVTVEMADLITSLDLSGRGIADIRDIINFQNVSRLDLSGNYLSDISDLVNLSYLIDLDISNNILQNIDLLNFTSSTNMFVNVSLNYITDFSMLRQNTQCLFTLVGTTLQRDLNETILSIGTFYSDVDKNGNATITYSAMTNQDYPVMLNVQNISEQINADNSLYDYFLPNSINKVEQTTITMGEQSDTTYIVPLLHKNVTKGHSITIPLGLPEDYDVRVYYNTIQEAVELQGNNIVYTATDSFDGDTIYYEFRKEGQIKGYSRIYLQESTTRIDEINTNNLIIYPNLVSSICNVIVPDELRQGEVSLAIVTTLGQVVHQENIQDKLTVLDVSGLANGVYFVVIFNQEKIISNKKLIKNAQ